MRSWSLLGRSWAPSWAPWADLGPHLAAKSSRKVNKNGSKMVPKTDSTFDTFQINFGASLGPKRGGSREGPEKNHGGLARAGAKNRPRAAQEPPRGTQEPPKSCPEQPKNCQEPPRHRHELLKGRSEPPKSRPTSTRSSPTAAKRRPRSGLEPPLAATMCPSWPKIELAFVFYLVSQVALQNMLA